MFPGSAVPLAGFCSWAGLWTVLLSCSWLSGAPGRVLQPHGATGLCIQCSSMGEVVAFTFWLAGPPAIPHNWVGWRLCLTVAQSHCPKFLVRWVHALGSVIGWGYRLGSPHGKGFRLCSTIGKGCMLGSTAEWDCKRGSMVEWYHRLGS